MTLSELYKEMKTLPDHDDLLLEDYRFVQNVYDPGNDYQIHFYLTGPGKFFVFNTQIDEGYETTLADYKEHIGC